MTSSADGSGDIELAPVTRAPLDPERLRSEPWATHAHWMGEALADARRAAARGEVPVGAVMVADDELIARGFNLRESSQDPTAHAELIAARAAAARLGSFRLEEVTCYVTLEPCPMCAGALVNARLTRLVYGARDPKAGAVTSLYGVGRDPRLNHRFQVVEGVLERECGAALSEFFQRIRRIRSGYEND